MHLGSVAYANACCWEYATYVPPFLKKRSNSSKRSLPTLLHHGKFSQLGYLETVSHVSVTLAQWCKTDALLSFTFVSFRNHTVILVHQTSPPEQQWSEFQRWKWWTKVSSWLWHHNVCPSVCPRGPQDNVFSYPAVRHSSFICSLSIRHFVNLRSICVPSCKAAISILRLLLSSLVFHRLNLQEFITY